MHYEVISSFRKFKFQKKHFLKKIKGGHLGHRQKKAFLGIFDDILAGMADSAENFFLWPENTLDTPHHKYFLNRSNTCGIIYFQTL